MFRSSVLALTLVVCYSQQAHAGGLVVQELRTQKTNNTTYFLARFADPADRVLSASRRPHLVPQDGTTSHVYVDAGGFAFLGKVEKLGPARFLLLYPTRVPMAPAETPLAHVVRQLGSWREIPVQLDLDKAQRLESPPGGLPRAAHQRPLSNDLEGRWALALADRLAALDSNTPDYSFYSFAREAVGRKYRVPVPPVSPTGQTPAEENLTQRLYALTTGAEAIAETLALERMRRVDFRDEGPRTIPLASVPGIDIPEMPWDKLLAGKKAEPEPLARLAPHDFYYLHFKTYAKYTEMGDLMDLWGTTLTRTITVNSRDARLKERGQQQLSLKNTLLTRAFGPAAVKSLAFVGSDPQFGPGTDITMLFQLNAKGLLLKQLNEFLKETRKVWGDLLAESRSERHKITIESYVTPRREVSLHRAVFDDYIVCGNSLLAVQRVLDVYKGQRKSLADSLDFQYMRVSFPHSDDKEDGFLFFSDAFLRRVVGPEVRIKERRRLEALTSLRLATDGAMFCAWETGQLPRSHDDLLRRTGLKDSELFTPEGTGVRWIFEEQRAVSDAHGTLRFATPLLELPLDKVTVREEKEYRAFRTQYLSQWRGYFDPIGVRMRIGGGKARVETHILPLVQNSIYNEVRRVTAGGTIKLNSVQFDPNALVQFFAHLNPRARERVQILQNVQAVVGPTPGGNWLGRWFTLRLDDSDIYGKLLELAIIRELDPTLGRKVDEALSLLLQMPVSFGVEIGDPVAFAGILGTARKTINDTLGGIVEWEPLKQAYRGVPLLRFRVNKELLRLNLDFHPTLYSATIDGAWYVSPRQEPLRELIDLWAARNKQQIIGPVLETAAFNTTMHMAPRVGVKTRAMLRQWLEWETHQRALNGGNVLYPLYRSGLLPAQADTNILDRTTLLFLGYVPTPPDHSRYQYEPKTDDVTTVRHGSQRRPILHAGVEDEAPLGNLVNTLLTIHVEMWFREDGLNAVLHLERKK